MGEPLIQERINELLEKTENPKEFTKGQQELLKSHVDIDLYDISSRNVELTSLKFR